MLDDPPKLMPVDEQPNDQIVHPFGLRKTDRTANQTLDSRPQVNVFALDFFASYPFQLGVVRAPDDARKHPSHPCNTS